MGIDEDKEYTTYIVVTKSSDFQDVQACALLAQNLVKLPLLKVSKTLGFFVLRENHN